MKWHVPFDTSIPLLDVYLSLTSPKDLAHTMTGNDQLSFSKISRQNIVAKYSLAQEILTSTTEVFLGGNAALHYRK